MVYCILRIKTYQRPNTMTTDSEFEYDYEANHSGCEYNSDRCSYSKYNGRTRAITIPAPGPQSSGTPPRSRGGRDRDGMMHVHWRERLVEHPPGRRPCCTRPAVPG